MTKWTILHWHNVIAHTWNLTRWLTEFWMHMNHVPFTLFRNHQFLYENAWEKLLSQSNYLCATISSQYLDFTMCTRVTFGTGLESWSLCQRVEMQLNIISMIMCDLTNINIIHRDQCCLPFLHILITRSRFICFKTAILRSVF